jgi:hypothetical protein
MIRNTQKFLFTVMAAVLTMATTVTAQNDTDAYKTETFSTSSSPDVAIETSGGFIRVYGHDEDEVRIAMFVRRGNEYLNVSDTDLSDYDIVIEQQRDRITASARREGSSGWFNRNRNNLSISFELRVPRESVVNGKTSGGNVTAENLTREISLKTSGGGITARHLSGEIDLQTSGGNVNLTDLSGSIHAQTSGGSVQAEKLSGKAELRTSGGNIRLAHISAELSARTSGGSIRADFDSFTENADLRTSGGNIIVQLPSLAHFDLDLSGSRVQTELRNFSGESQRNRINGRIGDGGPKLSARTSGGRVELSY